MGDSFEEIHGSRMVSNFDRREQIMREDGLITNGDLIVWL